MAFLISFNLEQIVQFENLFCTLQANRKLFKQRKCENV